MNAFQNIINNLRVPVPVSPDRPEGPAKVADTGMVLSKFFALADDIAKLRESAEYVENVSMTKKAAIMQTGIVTGSPNYLSLDPVPQGVMWELHRVIAIAQGERGQTQLRLYANQITDDQVIGQSQTGIYPTDVGVCSFEPEPYPLKAGETLVCGITPVNGTATQLTITAFYKSVEHGPMSLDPV